MKDMENILPLILDLIWQFSQQDIETTVQKVTKLFLEDVSVPWIIRFRRQLQLERTGQLFLTFGGAQVDTIGSSATDDDEDGDVKKKLEEALLKSVQRKDEDDN